jgi:hypothetical protein
MINVGLQIKPAKFSSRSPIRLKLNKPIVIDKEVCTVLKPESETIRILGSGRIQ